MVLIGQGSETDRNSIPLSTRRGTFIPNETYLETHPSILRVAIESHTRDHPYAELRSATGRYNCMGLAFASRRTSVDIKHVRMILREDGYRRLANTQALQVGDIVLYGDGLGGGLAHVGITARIDEDLESAERGIRVLSQWGYDGEYLHWIEDVPLLLGRPVEFWTDRKDPP
jgi:cell wall-associated NlpC family hydrolase